MRGYYNACVSPPPGKPLKTIAVRRKSVSGVFGRSLCQGWHLRGTEIKIRGL